MSIPSFSAGKLIPGNGYQDFLPFDVDSFDVKMYSDKCCDKRDVTKWLNAKLQTLRIQLLLLAHSAHCFCSPCFIP